MSTKTTGDNISNRSKYYKILLMSPEWFSADENNNELNNNHNNDDDDKYYKQDDFVGSFIWRKKKERMKSY